MNKIRELQSKMCKHIISINEPYTFQNTKPKKKNYKNRKNYSTIR